jgi:site-specific recombinase XerD
VWEIAVILDDLDPQRRSTDVRRSHDATAAIDEVDVEEHGVEIVVDDDVDTDDDDGEWLGGLRRLGLVPADWVPAPMRARTAVEPGGVAVLDAAVAELVEASWAPSTRHAYEKDWADFAVWCSVRGFDPDTAVADDVARYVADLVGRGLALATIRRRLAAIAFAFRTMSRPSPTRDPLVERVVAGVSRVRGTGQRKAAPLLLDQLRQIVTYLTVTATKRTAVRHRRDRALLLVGWAAALRREELVALNVDDLVFDGDPHSLDPVTAGGMVVRKKRSKTSQTAEAWVPVPFSQHHWGSCPVRTALTYSRQQGTGPLFCALDQRSRGKRLTVDAVNLIIKRHVAGALGENPDLYSGHSLRAGFVTEARARGLPDPEIARVTLHRRLQSLQTYDRPTDLLRAAPRGEWW